MNKKFGDSSIKQRRSQRKRRTRITKSIIHAYKPKLGSEFKLPLLKSFDIDNEGPRPRINSNLFKNDGVDQHQSQFLSPAIHRPNMFNNQTMIDQINRTRSLSKNDISMQSITSNANNGVSSKPDLPFKISAIKFDQRNDDSDDEHDLTPIGKNDTSMIDPEQKKFIRTNRRNGTTFSRMSGLNVMNKSNIDNYKDQHKKYDVRRKSIRFDSQALLKFKKGVDKSIKVNHLAKSSSIIKGNFKFTFLARTR